MANSGGSQMEKGDYNFYKRNHGVKCRKKLGAYYSCGSKDHMVKYCPTESKLKYQYESGLDMAVKSSSVQRL